MQIHNKFIGLALNSDWLRKWREFFKIITGHSKAKQKYMQIAFN